jgi:CelD/BcsL family acetyltransferase involved in cellulose biosynthesis
MEVRLIDDSKGFAELEAAWNVLLCADVSHPFQEFGWCDAWLKTIGTTAGRRPHVLTLWEGADLIGVLPLTARRFKGVRILEWIGARSADYCDVILDPRLNRSAALRRMWDGLKGIGNFDVLRMGQVRVDAKVNQFFTGGSPWVETLEKTYCFPITWQNGESWVQAQSAKSRARIRRGSRRMAELGLEFHIWQPGEPLQPFVECVIQQKLEWIVQRNAESFLTEPEGRQFVRDAATALAKSGSLHLSVMKSVDAVVATHLGFYRGGTLYYYMPTYQSSWRKHRVGTALLDALVMWACDHGVSHFDMLRGSYEYKTDYGVNSEDLRTLVIGNGLLGKAALSFYRFRQRSARRQMELAM